MAIARKFESAIHVLSVVDLQTAGGTFTVSGLDRELVERLEARGQEAADGTAGATEETGSGVTAHAAVERTKSRGGAAAGIREYVEEPGIDLVAMGSHGRSNFGRRLLGSVATTVLRTVDVPVLVVKRTE